jgi:hypothetical protein
MIVLDLNDLPAPELLQLQPVTFDLTRYIMSLFYLDKYEPATTVTENPILAEVEDAVSLASSLICEAHSRGYQIGLAVLGLPGQPFPIYHSFPHRMKMLESLSMLDIMQRSGERVQLSTQPSVLIKLGQGMKITRGITSGTIVLGAAMLSEYVVEHEGGAVELLNRRISPSSRRELVTEGKS